MAAGSGNITDYQAGFVEYYLGSPSCAQLPGIDVVFGAPTTTDAGGLTGTATADHEYNGCIGQANYHATTVGAGTRIARGWNFETGTVPPPSAPSQPTTPASSSSTALPPSNPARTPFSPPTNPTRTATPKATTPSRSSSTSAATPGSASTPGAPDASTTAAVGDGTPASSPAVSLGSTSTAFSSLAPLAIAGAATITEAACGIWHLRGRRTTASTKRRRS